MEKRGLSVEIASKANGSVLGTTPCSSHSRHTRFSRLQHQIHLRHRTISHTPSHLDRLTITTTRQVRAHLATTIPALRARLVIIQITPTIALRTFRSYQTLTRGTRWRTPITVHHTSTRDVSQTSRSRGGPAVRVWFMLTSPILDS